MTELFCSNWAQIFACSILPILVLCHGCFIGIRVFFLLRVGDIVFAFDLLLPTPVCLLVPAAERAGRGGDRTARSLRAGMVAAEAARDGKLRDGRAGRREGRKEERLTGRPARAGVLARVIKDVASTGAALRLPRARLRVGEAGRRGGGGTVDVQVVAVVEHVAPAVGDVRPALSVREAVQRGKAGQGRCGAAHVVAWWRWR